MNKEWITDTIEELAGFGRVEHGVTRLALTTDDVAAREYVADLMRREGLSVRSDAFGNIIGRLEGTDKTAAVVATGSHLDTVPEGGKYDGVVGVVGAIAAVRELKNRGPLTHPVEIIIFNIEESSRFGYATLGSKVMVGITNLSAWNKAKDGSGVTLPSALKAIGIELADAKSAARAKGDIKAFVELHIEGGAILERTATQIGVVEAIAAPTRLRVTIEGMAAHSGSTPMDERQDALISAAMVILAVEEIALEHHHLGTVGTVTVIKNHPNVMNVVPGVVELGIDIRGTDHESLIEVIQEIKDSISTIADERETPVSIEVLTADKPAKMNEDIVETIESVCDDLGFGSRRMNSPAGHDVMNIAHIAPAGLIFIPCRGGISHNLDEYATPDDIAAGVAVLTETLYKLAK